MKTITPKDLIKALKGGEFKKARGQLMKHKSGNSYCCLGVAACVADVAITNPQSGGLNRGSVERGFTSGSWNTYDAPTWAPWLTKKLQTKLAIANDKTAGYDGAIEILKKVRV